MLQRLPIAIAQVKAGNMYENLLKQIRKIIYSLYQAEEITKKVYNKIMHSENSETSDPHKLLLNISDEIKLKRSDKYVALPNLGFYYPCKNIKTNKLKLININKFKISVPTWNEEFELPTGSYSLLDIKDYFKCILKKDEIVIKII